MRRLGVFGAAALLCTCFGTGIVAIRVSVGYFEPLTFTMVRLSVIVVAFVLLMVVTGRSVPKDTRFLGSLALIGTLNVGVPYVLSAWALTLVSSTLYSILMNLIPVFSVTLAHFLLVDENLTRRTISGVAIAVVGASIVVWAGSSDATAAESTRELWLGTLLIVGNALCVAVSNILLRKRMRNQDGLTVTGGQMVVGLVLVAPLALLAEGAPDASGVPWQGWAALLWAALIGAFLGYSVSFLMNRRWGVTTPAVASTGVPLVTAIVSTVLLGERLTLPVVIGGLVLIGGVLTVLLQGREVPPDGASASPPGTTQEQ